MRKAGIALIFAMALVAARGYSQQRQQGQQGQPAIPPQGQRDNGPRQMSPMVQAEIGIQDAERQIREGQQGRGGFQGIGGQGQEGPDDPTVESYVNKTDLFSVSVPCDFSQKDIVWETEYESKVPGRVYNCKSGDTEYEMSVINYSDIIKIRAAQQHTDAAQGDIYARIDLFGSIDYASTKLRNEAAKINHDAFHYINLIPGHELQYVLPNGNRVWANIYLHEYRLYIMKATAAPKGIPPLLYTQSFAVVRPDGTAIRYPSIYRHPW